MADPIWLRLRAHTSAPRKAARQGASATRPRLRASERVLVEALDQLRAGVPLNWSQVEDDPELATLSVLQAAAWECRARETVPVPSDLRIRLLEQLSGRLPEPRPEPVKEPPKALAGFSEKVQVLTQAEEDVPPLTGTALPRVGLVVALALAVLLVGWGLGAFRGSSKTPPLSFAWIEVRQSNKTISNLHRPPGLKPLQCAATDQTDPSVRPKFVHVSDKNQLQLTVGAKVEFLPHELSVPTTYTLDLVDGAVSPCTENVPDPSDEGAIVKLTYMSRRQMGLTSADFSPLAVFQQRQQPVLVDVSTGFSEEVNVGASHGVYWRGGPYQDMEGANWGSDISVLIMERGELVTTFIGRQNQGITKEMLLSLVNTMAQDRK